MAMMPVFYKTFSMNGILYSVLMDYFIVYYYHWITYVQLRFGSLGHLAII